MENDEHVYVTITGLITLGPEKVFNLLDNPRTSGLFTYKELTTGSLAKIAKDIINKNLFIKIKKPKSLQEFLENEEIKEILLLREII